MRLLYLKNITSDEVRGFSLISNHKNTKRQFDKYNALNELSCSYSTFVYLNEFHWPIRVNFFFNWTTKHNFHLLKISPQLYFHFVNLCYDWQTIALRSPAFPFITHCFLTRNWLDQVTTTNRIILSQALIIIRSKRNTFIIRN